MIKTPPQRRPNAATFSVEALEGRQLLTGMNWSPYAKQLGLDQAAINFPAITGAGETIAVIDSGVNYKDPALGGSIGPNSKVVAGYDFVNKDSDPFPDTYAHGTGTAGVLAANVFSAGGYQHRGVAPGVHIIALRQADATQIRSALQWVLDNRVKYNIVGATILDYAGSSPRRTYQDLFKKAVAAGIFIAHPSGNGGATKLVTKGLDPADFSIGGVGLSGGVSSFTQRGPELDLLTPAEGVPILYYDLATKKPFTTISYGTSWASPVAVATAALIHQVDPRFTPMQAMKIMQDSGVNTYDAATNRTYKRLNVNSALALAYQRRGTGTQTNPPSTTPPTPVPAKQSPFSGKPLQITASAGTTTTIQAENFDNGGEGLAFHDGDTANRGGDNFRASTGVDVQSFYSGGRGVTSVYAGEWIEYTVSIPKSGSYTLGARAASAAVGGTFHIEVDGVNKTGALTIPKSKYARVWANVAKSGIRLTAGTHVLRLRADTAAKNGQVGNFDTLYLTRKGVSASVKRSVATAPAINLPVSPLLTRTKDEDGASLLA